jgi:curved DNA-binding protein CbpA
MTTLRTFDPYAVLGVSRDASPLQVARAHRRLAKRHHPDLHPGADTSEDMRRINEAWQILSNPVRRADYDLTHPLSTRRGDSHWASTRHPFHAAAPTSTRTWATWRASAAETRAAPRTRREPGEIPIPRTRRPARIDPEPPGFLDTGWAALIQAAVLIALVLAAAFSANIGPAGPI